MNNPILISTAAFDGYDLSTAIAEIDAIGADGVEVAFIEGYTDPFGEEDFNEAHAEEIKAHLQQHALPCPSFSAHMDMTKERAVPIFKRRMGFARLLGARFIVSNAAPVQNKELFMANIRELGRTAEELGITIVLENPGDGQPNVMDTARQAAPVIEEIGLEAVRLNYDFGNIISHCFERVRPEEDYREALAQTAHFHIKDVERRGDAWGFTEIGRGMIDYGSILRFLAADPRPLPLSLEIPLRITRAFDASPIRAGAPVGLGTIRRVLTGSLKFVKQALTGKVEVS
jgi:sugar phosphate isomerase/epimerase